MSKNTNKSLFPKGNSENEMQESDSGLYELDAPFDVKDDVSTITNTSFGSIAKVLENSLEIGDDCPEYMYLIDEFVAKYGCFAEKLLINSEKFFIKKDAKNNLQIRIGILGLMIEFYENILQKVEPKNYDLVLEIMAYLVETTSSNLMINLEKDLNQLSIFLEKISFDSTFMRFFVEVHLKTKLYKSEELIELDDVELEELKKMDGVDFRENILEILEMIDRFGRDLVCQFVRVWLESGERKAKMEFRTLFEK